MESMDISFDSVTAMQAAMTAALPAATAAVVQACHPVNPDVPGVGPMLGELARIIADAAAIPDLTARHRAAQRRAEDFLLATTGHEADAVMAMSDQYVRYALEFVAANQRAIAAVCSMTAGKPCSPDKLRRLGRLAMKMAAVTRA